MRGDYPYGTLPNLSINMWSELDIREITKIHNLILIFSINYPFQLKDDTTPAGLSFQPSLTLKIIYIIINCNKFTLI